VFERTHYDALGADDAHWIARHLDPDVETRFGLPTQAVGGRD
jgi:hypothetical protein